jgi:hypothetical protein
VTPAHAPCQGCKDAGRDLTTAAGLKAHNIAVAKTGERVYRLSSGKVVS